MRDEILPSARSVRFWREGAAATTLGAILPHPSDKSIAACPSAAVPDKSRVRFITTVADTCGRNDQL